ncbi:MAG: hypothetical protein MUC63_10615 [Planctomycetes bacterium]|nr:hypothetical protein [Planctomycetota bacterium]
MKILLLGSDRDATGSLSEVLREAGYETSSPGAGSAGDGPVDAVVLDSLAPAAASRAALEAPAARRGAPLILIADPESPAPSWFPPERRPDAVLPKPLDVRKLVDLLWALGVRSGKPERGAGARSPAPAPPVLPRRRNPAPRRRT